MPGDFFSRDNIRPGMVTFHPSGFTHGPHPKAFAAGAKAAKTMTDEVAVMIDARDMLDMGAAGRSAGRPPLCRQLEAEMKLASLKGGRDGRLAVVSRDLERAVLVPRDRADLAGGLDDWDSVAPRLEEDSAALNAGKAADDISLSILPPAPARCRAPINGPTAPPMSPMSSWCEKRGAPNCPQSFWTDPLMYQGGSDGFIGPDRPDRGRR